MFTGSMATCKNIKVFCEHYSDVSNNRTGTVIYFQKIFLPIRSY